MKSYISAPAVLVLMVLLSCFAYAQGGKLEPGESERMQKAAKEKTDVIREGLKKSDTAIVFYGMVKDQYGSPVSDAQVLANYQHFDLFSEYFTKISDVSAYTDSQGCFEFEDLKGRSFFIKKIAKEGYAFNLRENTSREFRYDAMHSNPFMPDKNDPISFLLQKKPGPGFVEENTKSYRADISGSIVQVDIYEGFAQSSKKIEQPWGDMRIEIQPAAEEGYHTVKITLNSKDDWLLAKDSGDNPVEDYVAPEDGYSKSVEYSIKKRSDVSKDIYFKGEKESGIIYSRIHLKLRAGNYSVNFDGTLYTNLDGGKNLNYDRKYTLNRKIHDVSANIDKEPKNVKLYMERAELKRELSLYDDAIADINKALKIAPEDKGLQSLKERTQTNKKRHAELKAQGFKFSD